MISTSTEVSAAPIWNKALIAKYDVAGPRYTSYPTAPLFNEAFTEQDYRDALKRSQLQSIAPLSLYVHIPFCFNICYYCACNKVVTADRSVARHYLQYLAKEIQLQSAAVGQRRPVTQLHFGGGTPTFFDPAELTELVHLIASHFSLLDDDSREYSIEIDPRTVSSETLALLKGLGFNRISLGVQDFDPDVQKAINREQSVDSIRELSEAARAYRFKSISYDLIYGLPMQNSQTIRNTVEQVIELGPDRIALYNYAHLPERFKSQRAIDRLTLPSAAEKLDMLELAASLLSSAGYQYIGMDHFVKPDDELAIAQREGTLQRNFQGYSTRLAPDLVGIGVSAISSVNGCYAQNEKDLDGYYQSLDEDRLPIAQGLELSRDDEIRRYVISQLACNLRLDSSDVANRFKIDFSEYFSQELPRLKGLESDGLVTWQGDTLVVSQTGRVMLRNICMVFDKYLNANSDDSSAGSPNALGTRFSKVI